VSRDATLRQGCRAVGAVLNSGCRERLCSLAHGCRSSLTTYCGSFAGDQQRGPYEQRSGSKERAEKKAGQDARREASGEATQKDGARDTQRHLNRVGARLDVRSMGTMCANASSIGASFWFELVRRWIAFRSPSGVEFQSGDLPPL